MGTWGPGPFENDYALDWLGDVTESADFQIVETTLDDIDDSTAFADTFGCSTALAAAEIVAAISGRPGDGLPEQAREFAGRFDNVPSLIVAKARMAVHRVARRSELRSLWEQSDDFAEWRARVRNLEQRLLDRT